MIIDYLLRPDVIGIYIGIVGIILAYIFYVRSKEQIKPLIYIERTALIGKAQDLFPGSVEIRYNGKVVPVLSKARIVFWNGGRRTMEEDDIVRSDPIVVKFADPETRILDVRSVTTTRDVTNAKAILEDNCIRLSFDFLDQNDGLAFEAFYDCDSETKMILGGTVKGI